MELEAGEVRDVGGEGDSVGGAGGELGGGEKGCRAVAEIEGEGGSDGLAVGIEQLNCEGAWIDGFAEVYDDGADARDGSRVRRWRNGKDPWGGGLAGEIEGCTCGSEDGGRVAGVAGAQISGDNLQGAGGRD